MRIQQRQHLFFRQEFPAGCRGLPWRRSLPSLAPWKGSQLVRCQNGVKGSWYGCGKEFVPAQKENHTGNHIGVKRARFNRNTPNACILPVECDGKVFPGETGRSAEVHPRCFKRKNLNRLSVHCSLKRCGCFVHTRRPSCRLQEGFTPKQRPKNGDNPISIIFRGYGKCSKRCFLHHGRRIGSTAYNGSTNCR